MLHWKRKSLVVVNLKKALFGASASLSGAGLMEAATAAASERMLPRKRCLCAMLRITLWLSRCFGIAPIGWKHPRDRQFFREDGQCEFYVSKGWVLYTVVITVAYNVLFFVYYDFGTIDTSQLSHVLKAINSWSYYVFATILSLFGILKAKALCHCLNDVAPFLRKGLLCRHAKSTVLRTARIGFILITAQLTFQYAALFFMNWNYQFETHFSVRDVIDKTVHNVPFMFYYLFSTICSIFVGLFMCFDTTMFQTLNYEEIQAQLKQSRNLQMEDPEDEGSTGFNTMKIVRCKGKHLNVLKHSFIDSGIMEDMDGLRRLHESIRESLVTANAAFNPQITIHLFIELTVLVLHLYTVILYMNIPQKNKTADQFTAYCIDWLFVVVHTIGLLIFLLSCQGIRASVRAWQVTGWPETLMSIFVVPANRYYATVERLL